MRFSSYTMTLLAILSAIPGAASAALPVQVTTLEKMYREAEWIGRVTIVKAELVSAVGQRCGVRYQARVDDTIKGGNVFVVEFVGPRLEMLGDYLIFLRSIPGDQGVCEDLVPKAYLLQHGAISLRSPYSVLEPEKIPPPGTGVVAVFSCQYIQLPKPDLVCNELPSVPGDNRRGWVWLERVLGYFRKLALAR